VRAEEDTVVQAVGEGELAKGKKRQSPGSDAAGAFGLGRISLATMSWLIIVVGDMVDRLARRPPKATSWRHRSPSGLGGSSICSCLRVASSAAPETGKPCFC
jgi:hypothetical protein